MKHRRILSSSVAVAALAFASASALGGIIAEDNFDYTLGSSLDNRNGGTGWQNSWDQTAASGPGSSGSTIVSNLSFGSYDSSGKAVEFTATNTGGSLRTLIYDRQFASSASFGSTFWQSFLYKRTSDGNRPTQFDIEGSSPEYSTRFNMQDDELEEGTNAVSDPVLLNTTYLLVARRTDNGTASGESTLWVFDEAQFDALALGGITDAEFDTLTASDYTATVSSTGRSRDADGGDRFDILTQADNGTLTYQFDELRFGDTVADVTPNTIPEPAALALLGLGGVMLLSRRGRRD